jgi:hypothetical protein
VYFSCSMASSKKTDGCVDEGAREIGAKRVVRLPQIDGDDIMQPTRTEDDLPTYAKTEPNALERIAQLAASICEDGEQLPITAYPPIPAISSAKEEQRLQRQQQIITTFFAAIEKSNIDLIAAHLKAGLTTPETTNDTGLTPLLAAIQTEHLLVVKYLLDAGANINAYGTTTTITGRRNYVVVNHSQRTPLQHAAQLGNLPITKLLLHSGADDSLIAPDGQLALRLAASNGHREIVAILPRRRGGGLKRWKAKHEDAMRRCRKATHALLIIGKIVVWDGPRFFVWTVPKHVLVLPLVKAGRWVGAHWREIPRKVWAVLKKVLEGILKGAKKAPGAVWRAIKKIPGCVKDIGSAIWKVIKRMPSAARIGLVWLWMGVKKTGQGIGNVLSSMFAFLHTFCAAVLSSFQRITMQDVFIAFAASLQAIFMDAPKKIWYWMYSFSETSLRVLKALFGCLGECMWFILKCLIGLVTYVPLKIGKMLAACASSMGSGGKEVLVWIDPKRV